ncbi:MBL fold metallo-hydrolase [Streptacidiphilus sp. ASG 303]|uniref:MBL fold metallo-hydrolase n=1 Tax=Streptacidiphilus sp. ASG 303 TaxID=2896847 RepID=UPI001E524C50|nr:MBL fold metallo-hydrolase [Streptacidiphilus sp. ASG 303]MCD0486373.1 MBL fold metallo-hydrolase [Streptacidiphilus sp. ASG 303]
MAVITWWGHATATVEDSGVRLLTDPLLSARLAHLRRRRGPLPGPAALRADAALVSHLHADHLHLPSLRALAPGTPVLLPRGAVRAVPALRRLGHLDLVELSPGGEAAVGAVAVRAVPARHDGRRLPFGPQRVRPLGYVVQGAETTYFAGDTDLYPGLADEVGACDHALLPVGGWGPGLGPGHLDAERAAEAVRLLAPRTAVPVHFGTFCPVGLGGRPGAWFHAPGREFARHAARLAPDTAVHELAPGQSADLGRPGVPAGGPQGRGRAGGEARPAHGDGGRGEDGR